MFVIILSEVCDHTIEGEISSFSVLTRTVIVDEVFHEILIHSTVTQSPLILPISYSRSDNLSFLRLVHLEMLIRTDFVPTAQ